MSYRNSMAKPDAVNQPNKTALFVAVLIVCGGVFAFFGWHYFKHRPYKPIEQVGSLKLISEAFTDGQAIPKIFSCRGKAINPPLTISGIPDDAKSLALIMHDPDAPVGDFAHWLMWNIPFDIKKIEVDSVPAKAMQGVNDFHDIGYGAPCPPDGTHHYYFDLYALDSKLDLTERAQSGDLRDAMQGHIIAQTSLMGTYSKQAVTR